jgi:ELWxxDGT repeat protein
MLAGPSVARSTARRIGLLVAGVLVLSIRAVAHAIGGYLVKDINDVPVVASSNPTGFAEVGGRALFFASTPDTGKELWSSDGTEGGTAMVVDLEPGPASADARDLIRVGNGAFFTRAPANLGGDEAGSFQLWRTDGSSDGTVFVADIPGSREMLESVDYNGTLIFAQYELAKGKATLWRSDGTGAGTLAFMQFDFPGTCSGGDFPLATTRNFVVFTGYTASTGCEPWRTDGTARGTFELGDLSPGPSDSNPSGFTATAHHLFFSVFDFQAEGNGGSLWVTDGSRAGTKLVAPGFTGQAAAVGDTAYLVGGTDETHYGLWRSDGTPAGTQLLKPIPDFLAYPASAGSTIFFFGADIWASDGTASGTIPLKPLTPRYVPSSVAGATLLYFIGANATGDAVLWDSDGTANGTQPLTVAVHPANLGTTPMSLGTIGDRLFFSAIDASGVELWKSDGTPDSTTRVKDIAEGFTTEGSNPRLLVAFKGRVYFATRANGPESVWVSDGTAGGTTALPIQSADQVFQIVTAGDHLYILEGTNDTSTTLWELDGVGAPSRVTSLMNGFGTKVLALNGVLYALGGSLCRIDAKAVGPCAPNVVTPYAVATAGGRLFTATGDGKLAVTVGDLSSTTIIGAATGLPVAISQPTALGEVVYFFAGDGRGQEALWRSDGSEPGTYIVRNIVPPMNGIGVSTPTTVAAGERLFFVIRGMNQSEGGDLWISDGSAAGTYVIAHLSDDFGSQDTLAVLGDEVLFPASDSKHGSELWSTDHTAVGIHLVRDIYQGPMSSRPHDLTPLGDHIAFSACDEYGCEPYVTDGTEAGTTRVADIAPGAASSSPSSFARIGPRLFVSADDMVHGRELWVLTLCDGDCNGDGKVTIDELLTAVNLALTGDPIDTCSAIDANGDGVLTISDLIAAVASALNGCPL